MYYNYINVFFLFSDKWQEYCYNCLDVNTLEPNVSADSEFHRMLYDIHVNRFFGGVDPGPCKSDMSQSLVKCGAGQTCGKVQNAVDAICKLTKQNYYA